mgnify:CR=1 FL=1
MDHSNKTYPEAIETIANFLSIEIPRDKEATKIYESKKVIQNSLGDTKKIFESNLKNSTKAISYLKQRNILLKIDIEGFEDRVLITFLKKCKKQKGM